MREVAEGFECGILLENFNDVKEGDVLEAYETRKVERTDLSDDAAPPPPHPTPRTKRPTRPSERGRMGAGYVGILSAELHFPESGR